MMIYHVTNKTAWKQAQELGYFEEPSLATEGFIHNCTKDQVAGVLERYYKNQQDLILLHIDEDLLTVDMKYELAPSVNEKFPHIFGPINLVAVVKTEAL